PPQYIFDPRQLRDGWKLVQTPQGLFRERRGSTDSPAMWGSGLALWLASYFIGAGVGTSEGQLWTWWPIIGTMISAGIGSSSDTARLLWSVDSIAQAGGFILFLVGQAAGPDKCERVPLTVTPVSFVGGGQGVGLTGRF